MESWEDVTNACNVAMALTTFNIILYNYGILLWYVTAFLMGRQYPSVWTKPFFAAAAVAISCTAAVRVYQGVLPMAFVFLYGFVHIAVIGPVYDAGSRFSDLSPVTMLLLGATALVQTGFLLMSVFGEYE